MREKLVYIGLFLFAMIQPCGYERKQNLLAQQKSLHGHADSKLGS